MAKIEVTDRGNDLKSRCDVEMVWFWAKLSKEKKVLVILLCRSRSMAEPSSEISQETYVFNV